MKLIQLLIVILLISSPACNQNQTVDEVSEKAGNLTIGNDVVSQEIVSIAYSHLVSKFGDVVPLQPSDSAIKENVYVLHYFLYQDPSECWVTIDKKEKEVVNVEFKYLY